MKNGYKQTEIWQIPEDWEEKKLSELSDIVTGSTPPTNDQTNYGNDYLFVTPSDLGKGRLINNTERKLSEKGFSISRKYPQDSILFTCIGSTIGKSGIATKSLSSNQQINAIMPNKSFNSDFVFFTLDLMTESIRRNAGETAVPIINKTEFGNIEIPLPPTLVEQNIIAESLSDIDSLITEQEKLIAKKKAIKQGAIQELLTPKEGWMEKTLGEIGQIRMCKRIFAHETSVEGEIPFYKIGTFGKAPDAFITKDLFNEYKNKYPFPKMGDILISASGTIGRTVVYDGKSAYFQDSNIIWIEIDKKYIINEFLFFLYKIMKWNTEGGTIQRLYNDILNKVKVVLPSIKEQYVLAQVLSDMDTEIAQLENKLAKYWQIKQGMMTDLLTGKVRLI
ncbi:putative type I restriction enzyme specificity protein [Spirochaetia bacterium]|nr:putative type I restriction enzyme specificity protein [Spirochaetia bacterium]